MKKKLKKLFYIILRFYIPDCIKGHTFFLKKIKANDLVVDLGSNKGEFRSLFLSKKKIFFFLLLNLMKILKKIKMQRIVSL